MLGWDYQNWMLVIGLPMVIFLAYLSERGWVDNPRKNTKMSRATLTAASSPLRLNVRVLDLTAFTNADSQGALFALVDN